MDWAMSAEKRALLAGRENLAALETAGDVLRAHNGVCGDFVRIDLAGEFDGCDNSTRESLTIGLRSISHPLARRSLEKLNFNSRKI